MFVKVLIHFSVASVLVLFKNDCVECLKLSLMLDSVLESIPLTIVFLAYCHSFSTLDFTWVSLTFRGNMWCFSPNLSTFSSSIVSFLSLRFIKQSGAGVRCDFHNILRQRAYVDVSVECPMNRSNISCSILTSVACIPGRLVSLVSCFSSLYISD